MRQKFLILAIAASAAAGCGTWDRRDQVNDQISGDMDRAMVGRAKPAPAEAVSRALLPPLVVELPKVEGRPLEPRFDLNVNNAPAGQVFMAIVSGTRYSMVVHPDIRDTISVNLKDVTVLEALETLRDLYGYEYRVQGSRITVQSVSLQTRVFKVNYLQASRSGRSDVRVSSGSITDAPTATPGVPGAPAPTSTGALPQRLTESSRVTTSSESNFWGDILRSLTAIVGASDGRNVIVNPQSGVIVVRALPAELRSVESFLKAMQLIVERQVVLEAKILEVELREGFEAGVNWAGFNTSNNSRVAGGVVRPGTTLSNTGPLASPTALLPDGSIDPNSAFTATLGAVASLAAGATAPGSVFGLALQTSDFAALLAFIETQGSINVLSSPRVATLNNQKAVLKVGTDDFFVTNVSTTTTTTGGGAVTSPTITVQPFFSGVALDVTPQIDDSNNIILHVHPQVSRVIEQTKTINLGNLGPFTLPLASSSVNETDTIVRVQDGNIVAIGGLMRQDSATAASQVPGLGDVPGVGELFRQRNTRSTKSEIVILLKPTIIHSDSEWQRDLADTRERIRALRETQPAQPRPSQP
ncbi:MAG: pilus (MSHA type) biogenesis protein MshL [Burkholderiales bacterium]